MPSFECRKCLPTNVPDGWTNEKKAEVASLIRKMNPIFAIKYFRPIDMSLTNAKGISLHVTLEKGHCHHCKTILLSMARAFTTR